MTTSNLAQVSAFSTSPTPARTAPPRSSTAAGSIPDSSSATDSWIGDVAHELRGLITPGGPKQDPERVNKRISELLQLGPAAFAKHWEADKAALQLTKGSATARAKGLCGKLRAYVSAPSQPAAVYNASNYAAALVAVLADMYANDQLELPLNAGAIVHDLIGVVTGLRAGLPKKAANSAQAADWALGSLGHLPVFINRLFAETPAAAA